MNISDLDYIPTPWGNAQKYGSTISLDSPAFTGIPTAPTAASGTNTLQIATTEFVINELSAIDLGTSENVPSTVVKRDSSGNFAANVITANTLTVKTLVNAQEVDISNNMILLNKDQTGIPLTTLKSGIQVERGDESNYEFIFRESDTAFVIGTENSLQAVATREDSPTDKSVQIWDATNNRLTSSDLKIDNGVLTGATWNGNSIDNSYLTNNKITIGNTNVNLGDTVTDITGLTSLSSVSLIGSLTGNADTATKLATARTINGVAFDGTNNITIAATSNSSSSDGYYLTDGDFAAIGSWTTFKDAASALPTDGTGGTPTSTLTINTVAPLNGTTDGLYTKSGANLQGEGFSHVFTIDTANCINPAQITFNYKTSSNYSNGYMLCMIYDVTNSSLIYPTVNSIPATNNGIGQFIATFLPSTSISYRLILYTTTTTTTAWTFEISKVALSKRGIAVGAAIGNWNFFTPILRASGTDITATYFSSRVGRWRRSGSNMDVVIQCGRNSTVLGLSDAVSIYLTDILSGVTIDPVYCASNIGNIGSGVIFKTSSNSIPTLVMTCADNYQFRLAYSIARDLQFTDMDVSGGVDLILSIPIAQWTSNVNLASDFTEYAYNTSTTTTSDTTSFGYGSGGVLFQAFVMTGTSVVAKRVSFQKPIQATDKINVEIYAGIAWVDSTINVPKTPVLNSTTTMSGIEFGMVDSTHLDVYFYACANYAGQSWSTAYAGAKWRVRKVSNGNMAESLKDTILIKTDRYLNYIGNSSFNSNITGWNNSSSGFTVSVSTS